MDKILIVDDNSINLAILEELLADDYALATAESGPEAIEQAQTFDPDMILLDVMMPGMDGYAVCRCLKEDPDTARAKVILVSAKAMQEERNKGFEAGADAYVTKPFDLDDLLDSIESMLQRG